MVLRPVVEMIEQQAWLDLVAEKLQHAVAGMFKAAGPAQPAIQDFLYGTWLGHPFHPVLTDDALGRWVTALALDTLEATTGRKQFRAGADAAVALWLAGAVGSAITGLNDWQWTIAQPRRIGLSHAGLNGSGVVLYTLSWLLRRAGSRTAGR